MNTLEAIAKRKSTRAYTDRQIPEEVLDAILKAGCAAPVAMARYDSLHITVVQTKELIDRVKAARNACKEGLERKLQSFADDSQQVLQDLLLVLQERLYLL